MTPRIATRHAGLLGLGPAAFTYLIIGAAAIGGYALLEPGRIADVLFIGTSASAVLMVAIGIRRWRPAARRGWIAIGLALAMLVAANLLALLAELGLPESRVVADILFMAAYAPLFAGGFLFGRGTHRSDRTVLLDTGIVALAAVLLVWEFVIEPSISTGAGPAAMIAAAMPIIDILLVSLVAPLLLLGSQRSSSAVLLVLAFGLMGIGDSLYAAASLGAQSDQALMNLAWIGSYILLGTAALATSAKELGAAKDVPAVGDLPRLVVVAVALIAAPLVVMRETIRVSNAELLAFAVISVVMASLMVLRLQWTVSQLAAVDRRFRRFMNHAGFMALIKDAAGRYIYMNQPAEDMIRQTGGAWYGRTDRDLFAPDVAARRMDADATVRRTGETDVETVGDGGRVWHTERFLMPGTSGDVGVLGIDMTDRLTAEDAVRFQGMLLASVRDVVIVCDLDRRVTFWNRGAEQVLGFDAKQMLGRRIDLMSSPSDDRGAAVDAAWATLLTGSVHELDWEAVRRDGSRVWLNVRVSPLLGEGGKVTGYVGVANDVSERKAAELELARLDAAIRNTTDAIIITDVEDRVVYVNPAFERTTGYSLEEVRGHRPTDGPAGQAFRRALAEARAGTGSWRGDMVDRRRDGSDLIAETSISPILVDGSTASGHVTIERDVTRERAAVRSADRAARERVLIAETLSALRAGQSPEQTAHAVARQLVKLPEVALASVVTFGPDGLAIVLGQSDRTGEGVTGVELPRTRGAYLQQRAAAGPWVERWGQDETHPYFEMLTNLGIMAHAYGPIVVDGRPIGLLIAGSDTIDAVDRMTERLPALQEFAAITATLLGGAVADRMAEALQAAKLQAVIAAEAFHPVFQPIIELETSRICGYEGLMRFADGTPPDVRFEEASRLGVGLALEQACLGAVFEAARALPEGPWLNVNVSPELVLAGLAEGLLPNDPRRIVLEITEHQAITDYATFRAAIEPIRDRIQIAVDDAGAGFSSLRHIVELQPAMVKLDRSLVAGIVDDNARQAVVAGMVRFSQAAGLILIAEGIETEAELATIRQLGVAYGQGWLLGRPEIVQAATPSARRVSPRADERPIAGAGSGHPAARTWVAASRSSVSAARATAATAVGTSKAQP